MKREVILSIIRHVLSAVGGVLIARGIVGDTIIMSISGSVLTIAAIIWSVKDKTYTSSQLEGAIRQILTTAGMFLTFITPNLITEITGALVALLPSVLGSIKALKVTDVPITPLIKPDIISPAL